MNPISVSSSTVTLPPASCNSSIYQKSMSCLPYLPATYLTREQQKNPNSELFGYFNYNPHDLLYGPGEPVNLTHYFNETELVINTHFVLENVTLTNSTQYNNKILSNTSNSTDTGIAPKIIQLNRTITKLFNQTITRSIDYKYYLNNAWSVITNNAEYFYWKEGINKDMNRDMRNNCNKTLSQKQSPIDLCAYQINAKCHEHHQIRNRVSHYNCAQTLFALNFCHDINTELLIFLFTNASLLTIGGKYWFQR